MREYALIPLKNIVVFPRTRVTLSISRPRSVQAVLEADKGARIFIAAKQRYMDQDDPQPDDIYHIATVVQIISLQPMENGVQLVVEGLRRVQIEDWISNDPFARVIAMRIPEPTAITDVSNALVRHAHGLFERYLQLNRRFSNQESEAFLQLRSPSRLADVLTANLVQDHEVQQELLEMTDPDQRLEKVCVILGNEIEVLILDQRIRLKVREAVDKNQHEYYLREQIKVIQKELGQDTANEIQELRDRVAVKKMPPEIEAKILKEITKLERSPVNSAEINVIRNYVDWVLALPWTEHSEDELDTKNVEAVLDKDHYGLTQVKDRIIDFLAVRQLRKLQATRENIDVDDATRRLAATRASNKGTILCLIGPPGVGKTSLGESIAHAMNRPFHRISLGGIKDEADIRGHRRTYVGSLPGKIIQAMKIVGVCNPVFLLDEIDKITVNHQGDPTAALLEVLDPAQNHTFTDHYLEVPYDVSEVFFICTANNRHGIPHALADRMEIIDIPGYTEEEKVVIAQEYIWPRVIQNHALATYDIQLPVSVLRWIIASYTREAGVRSLERHLATICQKLARRVVREPDSSIRLTRKVIIGYLGTPHYALVTTLEEDQVGVATGLAWTEVGGTLLPVEVAVMPGHGAINLTGQQGEVMQESARTALSYIRSRATAFHIAPDFADRNDIHIHLPEGGVPKEGPSAGIAIASAMISAITQRPVRADTAMTGEITLRGRVLAIGGLRDKVLAAHRVGIRRIILPQDNKRDIGEIPERIRASIEFIFVTRMEEVEKAVLRETPLVEVIEQEGSPSIFAIPAYDERTRNDHQRNIDSEGPIEDDAKDQTSELI